MSQSHSQRPDTMTTKHLRRHACDRCRGQKLRCERSLGTQHACDRCARGQLSCITSPSLPMGRPRSFLPKIKKSRRAMKGNIEGLHDHQQHLYPSRQNSCASTGPSPDLNLPMIDPLLNETTLGISETDYNNFELNLEAFEPPDFPDLSLNLQESRWDVPETTADSVRLQGTEEQKLQRLWKLQSTLTEKVHWIESQYSTRQSTNGNLQRSDLHPLRFGLLGAADAQNDHPIQQMIRCSQTFLEIIQSFVTSYQDSVCSIKQRSEANVSSSASEGDGNKEQNDDGDGDTEDDDIDEIDEHLLTSPAAATSALEHRHYSGNSTGGNESMESRPTTVQHSALPPECQSQFPICLTIITCHILLLRLYRSVLMDLYASVQSLVAQYTPAGDLTGRLAVLDNFSSTAPFSNVQLDGSTLKLDGVLQITTLLQLSCDLLERSDKGVEIILTGAGHILSAPDSYISTLEALARQEICTGRGFVVKDNQLDGGRVTRLAPLRMLVSKIRRCLNETCL